MRDALIDLYVAMMEDRYGYPDPDRIADSGVTNDDILDGWEKYGGVLADLILGAVLPDQTLFATPLVGELGYLSGNNTWARAIATSATAVLVCGVYSGIADSMTVAHGPAIVRMVAGLIGLTGGQVVVCSTTAGSGTVMGGAGAPGPGQYRCEVGMIYDASMYAATQQVAVLFNPNPVAALL